MADISARDQFRRTLQRLGAPPPWRLDEEEVGVLLDAHGGPVLTVDQLRERPDAEVAELTLWVMVAVNTCAGFRATVEQELDVLGDGGGRSDPGDGS